MKPVSVSAAPSVADPARNPGTALEAGWLDAVRINLSAVERRCATLGTRRSLKKQWQVAWWLRAISCLDLTTLSGDETPGRVARLCAKARRPLRADIASALGLEPLSLTCAAVCVYHAMVPVAVRALAGSGIPVAAVAAGFPAGLSPFAARLAEIRASVATGAGEIDIVITRGHVLTGNWAALYDEVCRFREACGAAHLKAIIASGQLASLNNIARAALVCMMAGADFVKTSTGMEAVNATLPAALAMARAIRDYRERTGVRVGFKPAGGIKTAKQALLYLILMKEELGDEWLDAALLRIGASSLLTDLERQIEYHLTGRYAAAYRQPLG